ncbi:MAG: hypothetical protein Fur009_7870 [Candidatus Microgenomates bacterium]
MYELTVLLKNEADLQIVKDLITSFKGKVEKEDKWGEKTLAYPIGKNKKAFYFNILISMEKKAVKEFKQKLNFNEKIIRYLLLTVEK